jgi:hypothetical protein
MERTELMVGEETNRIRAGRLSRHRPDGEFRRVQVDRMLWKWNALTWFAPFPTDNSVRSNAGELRRQSRHVVVFPMEKRPTMKRRDGASEFPHSNEGCQKISVGRFARPRPEGRQSQRSNMDLQLISNDIARWVSELTRKGTK